MMIRRLVMVGALLISTGATAADFYAKPMLALVGLHGYDDAYAVGLGISRPLPQMSPYLGAEVDFLKSFSKLKSNSGDLSFSKVAAFAALTYPLDPRVQIKARVGLRYAAFSGADDDSDTGVDWGVGALLLLDSLRTVTLEYVTSDENNFTQVIAGLQLAF
jgi:hypothetical protein